MVSSSSATPIVVPSRKTPAPSPSALAAIDSDLAPALNVQLTAAPADNQWLATGPSVDHVIAAQINPGSPGARTPPLNLMVGRPAGYRGLDFISYSTAGRAVQAINNPWNAYSEFINWNNGSPDAALANDRLARRRESVLDLVREQFDALKGQGLSLADQRKLDAHFTAIRGIEIQAGGALANPVIIG